MGIADSMTRAEARRILGLGAKDGADVIRSAYRAALKGAHPDLGGSDEKLRLILEAYRTLDCEVAGGAGPNETDAESPPDRLEITPVIAAVGGRISTRLADGRRVTVALKRGHRNGDRVRVRDVTMTIAVKGRREMFVSGDDLCILVKTTAEVLQKGGRIKVKTPTGVRTLWAPRQTGTNHIIRIPGQGLPATSRHPLGNLILKLVPEHGAKESRVHARRRKFASDWAAA
jgi:DnaJ-class molecular chaperone